MPQKRPEEVADATNPSPHTNDFYAYITPATATALLACGAELEDYEAHKPTTQKVGVTLPKGWVVTGWHIGYRHLLDQKKRQRGSMFPGGDAYLLDLCCWFSFSESTGYKLNQVSSVTVRLTNGNGHVVQEARSAPFLIDNGAASVGIGGDEARNLLKSWLDKHYPDWKNPAAYWG